MFAIEELKQKRNISSFFEFYFESFWTLDVSQTVYYEITRVCLSVFLLSFCLSVCLSICLSVRPSFRH